MFNLESIMPNTTEKETAGQRPGGKKSAPWRVTLAAALLSATALSGFAAGHIAYAADVPTNAPDTGSTTATAIPPQAPATTLPDFTSLVARTEPAVVSITNVLKNNQAADQDEGGIQTPFGMLMPQQHPRAIEARGSGFIINPNGTIVTNNHVIKDAKSISVTLSDGTTLPAHLVGADPRTDLAVLKVDAGHKLPFIELGDSSKVRPGEWVVAMGNPFGLSGTVTAGIVSASGRDIGSGPYDNFIQIDAPINQGNSGGPLFTQDGRVIGVNSEIYSPSGGSVGIGFAIPSNMVKTVVADIQKYGHVTRGFLGVEAQPVSGAMAQALHLPTAPMPAASGDNGQGALVASIEPNSPAAKAGIQPGDVIRAVDGKTVATPRDLAMDIAEVKPGSQAKIDLIRDGSAQTVDVNVATLQADNSGPNSGSEQNGQGSVGVSLAALTPDMRSQLNLPASAHGAVVAQVQPGSPAEAAGIRQGDLIVGVGTHAVTSPGEAVSAIRSALHGSKDLALRIIRNGQYAFVAVNVTPSTANGGGNGNAGQSNDDNQG
jgi:serine protease Do